MGRYAHRHHIPTSYAEQLIDGVARDLTTTRYASFDDLAAYCYGVASTVGLLSMHIIGFAGREAIPYAVKLGVALQLTNILRDVREDWAAGRVYLPQEELAAFGLNDADISALSTTGFRGEDGVTERWRGIHALSDRTEPPALQRSGAGDRLARPRRPFRDRRRIRVVSRHPGDHRGACDGDVFSQRAKPRTRTALPRVVRVVVAVATGRPCLRRRRSCRTAAPAPAISAPSNAVERWLVRCLFCISQIARRFEVSGFCAILHRVG